MWNEKCIIAEFENVWTFPFLIGVADKTSDNKDVIQEEEAVEHQIEDQVRFFLYKLSMPGHRYIHTLLTDKRVRYVIDLNQGNAFIKALFWY